MPRTASMSRLLVGFALLVCLGCGLADYEERMDAQQKRVQILEIV